MTSRTMKGSLTELSGSKVVAFRRAQERAPCGTERTERNPGNGIPRNLRDSDERFWGPLFGKSRLSSPERAPKKQWRHDHGHDMSQPVKHGDLGRRDDRNVLLTFSTYHHGKTTVLYTDCGGSFRSVLVGSPERNGTETNRTNLVGQSARTCPSIHAGGGGQSGQCCHEVGHEAFITIWPSWPTTAATRSPAMCDGQKPRL